MLLQVHMCLGAQTAHTALAALQDKPPQPSPSDLVLVATDQSDARVLHPVDVPQRSCRAAHNSHF